MTIARALLKAKNVGVRKCKNNLSRILKKHDIWLITEHNNPKSYLIPYDDMLELIDILDELQDPETIKAVQKGREAIKRGAKGFLVSTLFKRIRAKR